MREAFMQQTLILAFLIVGAAAVIIYLTLRLIRALESRKNSRGGDCGQCASGTAAPPEQRD